MLDIEYSVVTSDVIKSFDCTSIWSLAQVSKIIQQTKAYDYNLKIEFNTVLTVKVT